MAEDMCSDEPTAPRAEATHTLGLWKKTSESQTRDAGSRLERTGIFWGFPGFGLPGSRVQNEELDPRHWPLRFEEAVDMRRG